jgi:hypothetical protein
LKPLLVGEANPYQRDHDTAMRYALHPDPPRASGGRLCFFVMGLDERTYLRAFDRIDLCHPKWSLPEARSRAIELAATRDNGDVIVVCGTKVAAAFGLPSTPFKVYKFEIAGISMRRPTYVVLPHPSGLCSVWHEPHAVERARAALRQVGVLVDDDCSSCGEDAAVPFECPSSRRRCGHHCNCSWSQDACCWCGATFENEG